MDGVRFRVTEGRKAAGDLRMEWLGASGEWQPMTFLPVFALCDFFYENEDVLYPPPAKGGDYFRQAVCFAMRDGWRIQADRLRGEKSDAARRKREAA